MIFIEKPSEQPHILEEKRFELLDAISRYGSIDLIPDSERNDLIKNYKHPSIQEVLFRCSYKKCVYCENKPSGGFLEIEHFLPRSLYPEHSLDWDNLLPSCKRCNLYKSDHDVGMEPIINPCEINPEPFFDYNFFSILPAKSAPNHIIAEKTIETLNLNRPILAEERSNLLLELHNYQQSLKEALRRYDSSDTDLKKKRRITKLFDSIEQIERLIKPDQKFSGLCKNFLKKCKPYIETKKRIEDFIKNNPGFL